MDKCAAGTEADKLRLHFDSLQRWNALVDAVNKRVDRCRSTIEQLKQYEVSLINLASVFSILGYWQQT